MSYSSYKDAALVLPLAAAAGFLLECRQCAAVEVVGASIVAEEGDAAWVLPSGLTIEARATRTRAESTDAAKAQDSVAEVVHVPSKGPR